MQELLLLSPKPSATRNEDSLLWWQLQTLVQGRCTSVDDARTTNSSSSTTTVKQKYFFTGTSEQEHWLQLLYVTTRLSS
ncbi:hypothetical protein TYRP_021404 [Tyrophagus putrescentiae]|nr:hypothetical protein TYRP_021404 [Tyrophagus putrescentiae]